MQGSGEASMTIHSFRSRSSFGPMHRVEARYASGVTRGSGYQSWSGEWSGGDNWLWNTDLIKLLKAEEKGEGDQNYFLVPIDCAGQ